MNTQYNHFTRLTREPTAASFPVLRDMDKLQAQQKPPVVAQPTQTSSEVESEKEIKKVKGGTHKVLGTGLAGDSGKQINSTILNVEKVARLADGDVNAVNIKAAVDLGEKVTRGKVQQALGTVATPLGAVMSAELMVSRIDDTVKDPNADNVKLLLKTGEGAARNFSKLSHFLVANSDNAVKLVGKYSDNVGRLLAKGLGSKAAGSVKAGLTGSQRVLGHVGTALNVGIAGLDVYIAGKDIKNYWDDPSLKNMGKMSIGVVTAAASIVAAAKVPGLSSKAAVVATLGDVAKISMDVNWAAVYDGAKTKTTRVVNQQMESLKQDVMGMRDPRIQRIQSNAAISPALGTVSATLGQTKAIGVSL